MAQSLAGYLNRKDVKFWLEVGEWVAAVQAEDRPPGITLSPSRSRPCLGQGARSGRIRINDCNGNPIVKGDKVTFFSLQHDGDVTGTVVGFRKGTTASTAGSTAVIVDPTTPGSRTSVWADSCEIV